MIETPTSILEFHEDLHTETLATMKNIHSSHQIHQLLESYEYFRLITELKNDIIKSLRSQGITIKDDGIIIDNIDRKQHNADLTVKSTELMRSQGGEYAKTIVPQIISNILDNQKYHAVIKEIKQVGMYINITLKDQFFINGLNQISGHGAEFGLTSQHDGEIMIAEYSSPNASKHLHPGHIRSTVIGQVLANMYDAVGYEVHRLNHINDRGGFGELIEGYDRWSNQLAKQGYEGNDLGFMIYTVYRKAEKAYDMIKKGKQDDVAEELKFLASYFTFSDYNSFSKQFESFKKTSQTRFHNLESGGHKEFEVWKVIYANSIKEFDRFYKLLDVKHDYTIGESFYEKMGKDIVKDGMDRGIIVQFTKEKADAYYQEYLKKNPDVSDKSKQKKLDEVNGDIGSFVALLDNYERYVVQRSDGASIYATRDLGCIKYRCEQRNPETIMYEVGGEQQDHFNKLFETARKFGRDDMGNGKKRNFLHIYHGLYVDSATKKKLSSREGATSVIGLLEASTQYFKNKYSKESIFTPVEIDHIAKTLGQANIIVNDIRKGRTAQVPINKDQQKTLEEFEKSGGAYLMYTLCRAKSVLAKSCYNGNKSSDSKEDLDTTQTDLIKQLMLFPKILQRAVELHEPSVLVDYIYEVTSSYNTLYSDKKYGKITNNQTNQVITNAVITVLENALKICNVTPLERM